MPEFRVFRYDPRTNGEARFQSYSVPETKGMTVLEGLYYILENLDASLSFRASCREGVCGSCAMHINGQYRLACETQIAHLKSNVITIRPLSHLPIIKDLVVDMEPFFQAYRKIRPYLIPAENPPEKEYIQSVKDRSRLDAIVDCILCGACYGSCPVALGDKDYLGPHALVKALRFVEDTRDGATIERLAMVAAPNGVFRCHTIFNCQQVCPKDIDPTGAIARLKRKVVWHKVKSFFGAA